MRKIKCVIMRGGTSKAVVLYNRDLPANPDERKEVILKIFGSPDIRQIDGLGGADPLTSKCAVIGPPETKDADINYTFYQVGIDKPIIKEGICGNISSAIGPFAIDENFVKPVEPITTVRIFNTFYKDVIYAEVPVKEGRAVTPGDLKIAGVPGTGAKIMMDWRNIVGKRTGSILPTGKQKDKINVEGVGKLTVSIIDSGNPTVFVNAREIGLKGTENSLEIDSNRDLLDRLEAIRGTAGELVGIIKDWRKSRYESPSSPLLAFVNRPVSYVTPSGEEIGNSDMDLVSRMMFMQKLHKTYAGSGALCTGTAAMIEGTVVNDVVSQESFKSGKVRIGHPGGVMEVETAVEKQGIQYILKRSRMARTARRIMEGFVYID